MDRVGYKVHLTETCDESTPHLIVNVETTPATTPDDNMLEQVHDSLKLCGLLPAEHLVDKGYTDAHVLVDSQRQHGVTIVGPAAENPSWQARGGGFDKGQFHRRLGAPCSDMPRRQAEYFLAAQSYPQNGLAFKARFSRKDCGPCPNRVRCTKSKLEPRIIGMQAREHHEALSAAHQRQKTEEFRSRYAA